MSGQTLKIEDAKDNDVEMARASMDSSAMSVLDRPENKKKFKKFKGKIAKITSSDQNGVLGRFFFYSLILSVGVGFDFYCHIQITIDDVIGWKVLYLTTTAYIFVLCLIIMFLVIVTPDIFFPGEGYVGSCRVIKNNDYKKKRDVGYNNVSSLSGMTSQRSDADDVDDEKDHELGDTLNSNATNDTEYNTLQSDITNVNSEGFGVHDEDTKWFKPRFREGMALLFFLGAILYCISLALKTTYDNGKQCFDEECYLDWMNSIFYIFLPLYISILLQFKDLNSKKKLILLAGFVTCASIMYIVIMHYNYGSFSNIIKSTEEYTNECKLGVTFVPNAFNGEYDEFNCAPVVFVAYCIIIGNSIFNLGFIHLLCIRKGYDSGILFKMIMILLYVSAGFLQFIFGIGNRFGENEKPERVYTHHSIFLILIIMLCIEVFKSRPKTEVVDVEKEAVIGTENKIVVNTDALNTDDVDDDIELDPELQKFALRQSQWHRKTKKKNIVNPNKDVEIVVRVYPDKIPMKKHRRQYFKQIDPNPTLATKNYNKIDGSIACVVPFYNEEAYQIFQTLKSLYLNIEYLKKKKTEYKYKYFNVLLVGDGWSKASDSSKEYLQRIYCGGLYPPASKYEKKPKKYKHMTMILQAKDNAPLCINPYDIDEHAFSKKIFLNLTTIVKIDNRKKANSHQWFLGQYGFGEWTRCEYMYFTDAYSSLNEKGLFQMVNHMNNNPTVTCCTGRARIYTIQQEHQFKRQLKEKPPNDDDVDGDDDVDDDDDDDKSDDSGSSDNDNEIKNDDNNTNKKPKLKKKKTKDNNETKENTGLPKLIPDDQWWEGGLFFKNYKKPPKSENNNNKKKQIHEHKRDVNYGIQDDLDDDYRLSMKQHLRNCQIFEFEALYGTIGSYLLGGFLPVIPGPCGLYRANDVLKPEVRDWYFEKVHQKDPDKFDLTLANMQLAEDRILTISSVFNSKTDVTHALLKDCLFYFDPITSLESLMKQRRRWINGSVATVIFVLRKVDFKRWRTTFFRRYYVLSLWWLQLSLYGVSAMSPPILFRIGFQYALVSVLKEFSSDPESPQTVKSAKIYMTFFLVIAWIIYLLFMFTSFFFSELGGRISDSDPNKKKKKRYAKLLKIMRYLTLYWSWSIGVLTLMATIISIIKLINGNALKGVDSTQYGNSFFYVTTYIGLSFFCQPFILPFLFSKDCKTFINIVKSCLYYFVYQVFYQTMFFIFAMANVHDLSWGTRPADGSESKQSNNLKQITLKVLVIIIILNILIYCLPIFNNPIILYIFVFPSVFQVFTHLIYETKIVLSKLWRCLSPKSRKKKYKFVSKARLTALSTSTNNNEPLIKPLLPPNNGQ